VANAENQLSYTYLRAPFAGTVVGTFVENFETVQAKQPVVRLVDTTRIEMVIDVPETMISRAPLVKTVYVTFDAFPGHELAATIKEIGTEASRTTRTYPITLIMDQPENIKILPGMAGKTIRADADLPPDLEQVGIQVPVGAIFTLEAEAQSYVWVIDGESKTIAKRSVSTGEITATGIRVTAGLVPGEWIVIAGVHSLEEGQKVQLLSGKGE
jgi:RND family efflux transporter MFP subunit